MISRGRLSACIAFMIFIPAALQAQEFKLFGQPVQVHGFASQGFAYSNQNNYLTMPTSKGSFAMTDFGANVSSQITDRLRVGAQIYNRNVGNLGDWYPQLDWAFVDYRFTRWIGVRGGKVKTVLGLYNDTQDMEFLHTWAILPQSVYPLDLRSSTIAHTGVDLYGDIPMKGHGSLSYTGYFGKTPYDAHGGFEYSLQAIHIYLDGMNGTQAGGDLRWNNLLKGLTIGSSYLRGPYDIHGTTTGIPVRGVPAGPYAASTRDNTSAFYVQYRPGKLKLDGEYRREQTRGQNKWYSYQFDQRFWYGSAAYRICRQLEVGAYASWYYTDWHTEHSLPTNHLFDRVITGRIDINRYIDIKVEGHFMDGTGLPKLPRGIYPMDNPSGIKPQTNMFVVRAGFNF